MHEAEAKLSEPVGDLPSRVPRPERDGVIVRRRGVPSSTRPLARRPGALERFVDARE